MRITFLLLFVTSFTIAQEVTIFKQGKMVKTKAHGTSSNSIFTKDGTFKFSEIDSIQTDDISIKNRFTQYKQAPQTRIETLPVTDFIIESGLAKFQKVIIVEGKSAAELYRLVNRWVAITYNNPDAATYSKIENEMVRGRGFEKCDIDFGITCMDMGYAWIIDIKDSKIRFTMSDMKAGAYAFEKYVLKPDGSVRTNSQAQTIKESFENQSNLLLSSLITSMEDVKSKKDDW